MNSTSCLICILYFDITNHIFFVLRFRAVFKFEGNNLNVTATGRDFKDFKSAFTNDDRGFGYIRISVSIYVAFHILVILKLSYNK